MKVETLHHTKTTTIARKRHRDSTGFAALLADSVAEAEMPAPPSALPDIGLLLDLQHVPDPLEEERQKALVHGHDIMALLEKLQRTLVRRDNTQDASNEILQALTRLAAKDVSFRLDPHLRDAIRQLQIRALVEVAKREPKA